MNEDTYYGWLHDRWDEQHPPEDDDENENDDEEEDTE